MSQAKSNNGQCAFNNFKRTRYFHGQLLTERDFREEQIYHNEKRKLLNRMLHGWGVVCGLEVKATNPASACVIVEPGVALDCHGNEIIVCEEQTIDIFANLRSLGTRQPLVEKCAEYERQAIIQPEEYYIVIRYQDKPTRPEPVYLSEGSCEEEACDYSRTSEGFCIEVLDRPPHSQIETYDAWPGQSRSETFEPCRETYPCPRSECCPELHYLVLAKISCGPRFDSFTNNRIVKSESVAEIRLWCSRKFTNVCLGNSLAQIDKITVTENYEFDTEDELGYNSITWGIEWANITLPNGLQIQCTKKETIDRKLLLEYEITANSIAETGIKALEFPIASLSYVRYINDQPESITWMKDELPVFKSSILLSLQTIARSRTIFDALIRNVGYRKYVATFPWFAWLHKMVEGREDKPWSGDLSVHCGADEQRYLTPVSALKSEFARAVQKIQTKFESMMQAKVEAAEKKAEKEREKLDAKYQKIIAKLEKSIQDLAKKLDTRG